MSTAASQSARPLAITTPLGEDVLLLNSIAGSEELSTPFHYDLELQSEEDTIDPVAIVGRNVTVRVEAAEGHTRFINGYVSEFAHLGWADRLTSYRARIVPWLWFLDQTADCRIFQQKSTPDIVQQIFKDLGFTDFQLKLTGDYPPHEYCVQYRETDLNFVLRLLGEEGIFYFFRHENGKHTLVLADSVSVYFDIPDSDVEFPDPTQGYVGANRVTDWQHSYSFRPGKYTHTDYNFKQPSTSLVKSEATRIKFANMKAFEVYDYHGRHEDGGRGQALAKVRLQELETRHDLATGHSVCGSFTPGGKFTFSYHRSQSEIGKTYVLTGVSLHARLDNYVASDGNGFVFENSFECIPAPTLFRPQRLARKPVVEGPQTAVIVGPPGEEIYVDEFSRVKVQFHWDREGKRDENSSCWMRVSQAHAGAGWGYVDIPRVGEEVIVDFIEGDPDKPIITGRVYNGEVMPPFPLAGGNNAKNKTRRGNTTKTYKGGGFNEMSMDDTPGKEQIRVHGQKDMSTTIEHDNTLVIKNDETVTILGNRTEKVVKKETITITGGREEHVDAGEKITITGGREEKVDGGEKITIKGGRTENVTGKEDLTVDGGQKIKITGSREEDVGAGEKVKITGNCTHDISADLLLHSGGKWTGIGDGDVGMKGPNVTVQADTGCNVIGGAKLVLSGPGGSIVIDGSGVTIQGTKVSIN
jgi:type VI secretion system secreted protein VgrG